jgi:hypothetical protein
MSIKTVPINVQGEIASFHEESRVNYIDETVLAIA